MAASTWLGCKSAGEQAEPESTSIARADNSRTKCSPLMPSTTIEKTLGRPGASGATTRTPAIAAKAESANSRIAGSSAVKFSSATEAAINNGSEYVPGDLIGAMRGNGYAY